MNARFGKELFGPMPYRAFSEPKARTNEFKKDKDELSEKISFITQLLDRSSTIQYYC